MRREYSELQLGNVPLLGAELRVKRAKKLIGNLKVQLQGWADAHEKFLEAEQLPDGSFRFFLARSDRARLGRISITIGETAYNLRSALDYLVFDLAYIGTRREISGTQFPIEDKPSGFVSRISGRNAKGKPVQHMLKGVPPGAINLIAKYQPCNGCTWTKLLRELSNPEKHRHLTSLRSTIEATAKGAEIIAFDPETRKGTVRFRVQRRGGGLPR